jgi:hypothetical protein
MNRLLRLGVGSLPHLSLDAAIEFAFRFDIPFVPQLPALNAKEKMIPQALSGLIGFELPSDSDSLDYRFQEETNPTAEAQAQWKRIQESLSETQHTTSLRPFEAFLPPQETYRALRPFLWEASERGVPAVKVQLTGPWTCLQNLTGLNGKKGVELQPASQTRVLGWLLARSIALIRYIAESGVQPWLFIDEPYLFSLNPETDPRQAAFAVELGVFFQTLQKEVKRFNGSLGLHCCSDPKWGLFLGKSARIPLTIDFLSVDAAVSGHTFATTAKTALEEFEAQGGAIIWGVIPSNLSLPDSQIPGKPHRTDTPPWMISPACGLAYHSTLETEEVFERLNRYQPST